MPVKAGLTPAQIEDLQARAAKADENWDRLLRVTADFENFRKRAAKERDEIRKFAAEALMQKLVPILESFDMALAAANTATSVESLRTGIAMVHSQLKGALTEAGLEEIVANGQEFDPRWHEAVSHQESAEVPEGQVVQQLRKGYKLRERLLRPAAVVVARKPGP
jgi:molecular chaperone GrpE